MTSDLVIGAGVAGLAAAVELARAGLRPLVLESRPFVGGRVRSFVHAGTGDEIDNGQHLMMGCYHQTFRLLELIGTRNLVALQERLHVEFRDADGTPDSLRAASTLPSPLDLLAGMLRLRGLSRRERVALVRVAVEALRRRPTDETVTALLERLGQSRAAQERLWDPIVIATLNTRPEAASAELFLEVMRRAFLGSGTDSRLAIPRAGLSRLFDPAVGTIESLGGRVELGVSVTRIVEKESGHVVHLKDREPIEASRVIVALPPRGAASLLDGLLDRRTADALELSPIVSLYLWFDRPLDAIPELTALLGTRVQWVFNRRRMTGDVGRSGLLACTISAADDEAAIDAGAVVTIAERELRAAMPELAGARLVDSLVVKERHATFRAIPAIAPLRPSTRTRRRGLYLAGDWTATSLPATIEGAVQSGFDAARALLDDMRRAGPPR